MTEQNNQVWNRLRRLRDVIIRFFEKAKQELLTFRHNLPGKWKSLKSNTESLYYTSKTQTLRTWHKLKLFWQGKPVHEPPNSEEQADSDAFENQMTDSEHSLQSQPSVRSLTKVPRRRSKIRPIRRSGRLRVYRLKGYTTVAKVNRKHNAELQQQLLRKLLLFVGVIFLLIILFFIYNPVSDLSELYRIIGISDIADLTDNNPLFPDISPTPEP